jgi:hypothetical protein
LIGGHVPLGVLADLAGMMLDALEAHFVLYGEDGVPFPAAVPVADANTNNSMATFTPSQF